MSINDRITSIIGTDYVDIVQQFSKWQKNHGDSRANISNLEDEAKGVFAIMRMKIRNEYERDGKKYTVDMVNDAATASEEYQAVMERLFEERLNESRCRAAAYTLKHELDRIRSYVSFAKTELDVT